MTYPSGHGVAYNYDNAGRLGDKDAQNLAFTGNLGDGGTSRNYSRGIIYSALGGMTKEQFGTTPTPIFNKRFYDVRGQLAEIREGTTYSGPSDTGWERGAIINDYSDGCTGICIGQSMTDNNGNLKKQQHLIPNADGSLAASFAQQYQYDTLNRLKRVYDGTNWQQGYTYDRWGNRSINNSSHPTNPTFGQGINNMQAAVVPNTLTNRLYGPGETEQNHPLIDYDAAGNQTKDYYTDSANSGYYDRTYDAGHRFVRRNYKRRGHRYCRRWKLRRDIRLCRRGGIQRVEGPAGCVYLGGSKCSIAGKHIQNGQTVLVRAGGATTAAEIKYLMDAGYQRVGEYLVPPH